MNKKRLLTLMGAPRRVVPYIYPTMGADLAPQAAATTTPVETDAIVFTASNSELSTVSDVPTGSLGAKSLNILATINGAYAYFSHVADPQSWVVLECYLKSVGDTPAQYNVYDGSSNNTILPNTENAEWTRHLLSFPVGTGSKRIRFYSYNAEKNTRVDDVTLKQLTTASLLANPKSCTPGNVIAGVKVNIPTGLNPHAGVMINLDSLTTPANGVLLTVDNMNATIWKLLAGVWSKIYSSAITAIEDGLVQIRNSGTDYEMWYNGAKVGNTQVIADTFTGTIACQFSTSSLVRFS